MQYIKLLCASGLLAVTAAIGGCGLAGTAAGTAVGAATEAQQAKQAPQIEQQVRDRVEAAERENAAKLQQAQQQAQ